MPLVRLYSQSASGIFQRIPRSLDVCGHPNVYDPTSHVALTRPKVVPEGRSDADFQKRPGPRLRRRTFISVSVKQSGKPSCF